MGGYIPSIMLLGDSILEGMTPYLYVAFRQILVGKLRAAVYSTAGSSAKDWAGNRWARGLARDFRPNIVVVLLGTNPQERDEYEYAGMIQRICEGAQEGGAARCYAVGPFALDDNGRRNNAVRWAVGGSAINGYELAAGLPRAGEGNIHFTPLGYQRLAERLVHRVRPGVERVRHPGGSINAAWITTLAGSFVGLEAEYWLSRLAGR